MPDELEVLVTVIQRLKASGFACMITGSIAANYYAQPRMTRDIDLVIEITNEDIPKLIKVFSDDFYIDPEMIQRAILHESLFNILHNQTGVKVDLIIRKASEYHRVEFSRRKKITIQSTEAWIVAPEDLILSKLMWAKDSLSEIQLRDIQNILTMVGELDHEYLKEWLKRLSLEEIFSRVKI